MSLKRSTRVKSILSEGFREYRGLIVFLALMSVFRSSVADWNYVPTASMRPTIIEGDRVLINKLAYDVQLPFVAKSIYRMAHPERGDIVVIKSEASGKRLIKRVIGVPGDRVELHANRLQINSEPMSYVHSGTDQASPVYLETIDGFEHKVRLGSRLSTMSSFSEQLVPDDHYLVLGDNRGNSADSRFYGFVPRDEIIGRSRRVVLSMDVERYYLPRRERIWEKLDH